VERVILLDSASLEPAEPERARLETVIDQVAAADVVFLGEANHFVHEKNEFRLWWLRRLAARRPLVVGEELSWSDGRDVAHFLATGDPVHLDRAATFGDHRHVRSDRDDTPSGVLAASHNAYPTALFKAEQSRFYRALRALPGMHEERRFFGFDIDAPGAGYDDVAAARGSPAIPAQFWAQLERVEGETLGAEADRLEAAAALLPADAEAVRVDLDALIGTLRYAALAMSALDYEALRPAMALREELMKNHVERILAGVAPGELVVLMGHAFHLIKDDSAAATAGVGPGGGVVPSLGHHLVASGLRAQAVWMLYGEGEDSQPFPDLPRRASYPAGTLNTLLARHRAPLVLPVPAPHGTPPEPAAVGHMYNAVVPIDLRAAVDAIHFIPTVTPLRDERHTAGPSAPASLE
jgi:hypothetical protein